MDPANYVGMAPELTDKVIAKARKCIGEKKAKK
jgi:hypothetical protein